jgi:serine/threonine-protein kinase
MVTSQLRLVKPLATGGMGTLWVADHLALDRQVAVKFISAALDPPEALERFRREATATARIKSPHVVQVHDYGSMSDGTPYLALELLDGESLAARIDGDGPLPLRDAAEVVLQLGRALAAAHKVGIVHRDIKPDNVFLVPNEDSVFVKILDFGVAKTEAAAAGARAVTSAGATIGSPGYMSPEQMVDASRVDHRADLWALAVCAYEMLTAQLPFAADTHDGLVVAVTSGRFRAPSDLCEDATAEVDAWFERAFAKNPATRFESAREMALAFAALVPEIDDEFSDAAVAPEPPPSVVDRTEGSPSPPTSVRRVPFRDLSRRRPKRPGWLVPAAVAAVGLGAAAVWSRTGQPEVVEPPRAAPTAATVAPVTTAAATAAPTAVTSPGPVPSGYEVPTPGPRASPLEVAAAWRDLVENPIHRGKWRAAVDGLEQVMTMDPDLAGRQHVQDTLLQLIVKASLAGTATEDKLLDLLTTKMDPRGLDLLFEVMVRYGGSRAATRAADLLARQEIRSRGSTGMQVAYAVRTAATCGDKRALLDRVAAEGDHRALRELKAAIATECPELRRDESYRAARKQVLDRLNR